MLSNYLNQTKSSQPTNQRTNDRTDERTNGPTDRPTDRKRTNKPNNQPKNKETHQRIKKTQRNNPPASQQTKQPTNPNQHSEIKLVLCSFHCNSLTVTATYFKRNDDRQIQNKKMSKHKKTVPLLLVLKGQMHLYLSVYFHFHATDLLKQYFK